MILVVAYKESTWMDDRTDFRQWDHLCRAYDATLVMVSEFHQCEILDDVSVVLLDQFGETELSVFEHPAKSAYVFGRTSCGSLVGKIPADHTVRIETPKPIEGIFGVSICAAVLYDREMKRAWQ